MQFVIITEHPPELCPMSNAKIRELATEGAKKMPSLAQKLGINIIAANVFGPDHVVLFVVEAPDIDVAREFIVHSRFIQWSTCKIHATWSIEEAVAKFDTLPAIF